MLERFAIIVREHINECLRIVVDCIDVLQEFKVRVFFRRLTFGPLQQFVVFELNLDFRLKAVVTLMLLPSTAAFEISLSSNRLVPKMYRFR